MPELPDIEVFAHNLKARFAGKKLKKVNVLVTKRLKDEPEELASALEGKTLENVFRSGKELRWKFSGNTLLGMHLMLTGDIFPFQGQNENKFTIVELYFSDGTGLALTDRMKNANIKLNPVDKDGVDALAKELNFEYLKAVFQKKCTVKSILLDQNIIRGIGNGYSDEILWQAKISPFSTANAIPDDKLKELPKIIRKVLTTATKKIMKSHPGLITGEVKDYLDIHHKKKTESPTGFPILVEEVSGRRTHYTEEQVLYK
ncbi:DNA-formamidopyrimidine glycosylase family protein [Aridibaculum aurantiacum]|uniref:DNA-formamidopyrimidine glycosylase family protein n=1 Tax=Aridibaculum aurantiacum TaxID=2810307 RepID=UPI001A971A1D|nr:DNA-formamidopyrimidine glycosylase family protein [Aridibaculum aurantiacum]